MSYEDGFVHLANRIEPDDGLRDRVLALEEQAPKRRKRPALKYAVSFALVAAVLVGSALILPQNLTGGHKSAKAGNSPMQQFGFTVYADAVTTNGKTVKTCMTENKSIAIQAEQTEPTLGGGGSRLADGKFRYDGYYALILKCVGEGIDKVTYETNQGIFEQPVAITEEQKNTPGFLKKSGYDNLSETDRNNRNFAYKPSGNRYSVNCDVNYGGNLMLKYTAEADQRINSRSEYSGLFTQKIGQTTLKITAHFSKGQTCVKTVALSQDAQGAIQATLLD